MSAKVNFHIKTFIFCKAIETQNLYMLGKKKLHKKFCCRSWPDVICRKRIDLGLVGVKCQGVLRGSPTRASDQTAAQNKRNTSQTQEGWHAMQDHRPLAIELWQINQECCHLRLQVYANCTTEQIKSSVYAFGSI